MGAVPELLGHTEGGRRVTVGYRLLTHIGHTNRHLGMIESLTGVYDNRGTATV